MLDIKTPLSKCVRISRKVPTTGFTALPGVWLKINNDGSAQNVALNTEPIVAKLNIGTFTGNTYESNDVEVGRITTLETIGARVTVDSVGYSDPTIQSGYYLQVATDGGAEGKLECAQTGNTIVAIAEGWDTTNTLLTYMICDPTIMPATTTVAPPTTHA